MFAAGPNWKRLRTFVAATLNQNQLPQVSKRREEWLGRFLHVVFSDDSSDARMY